MRLRSVVYLALLVSVAACSKENGSETALNSPSPSPSVDAANQEKHFQSWGEFDSDVRAEARKATLDYLATVARDWKVKGLSSQLYESNTVYVAADLERGQDKLVVMLITRKFFPEQGASYWRTTAASSDLQNELHNLSDRAIQKELDKFKARDGEVE